MNSSALPSFIVTRKDPFSDEWMITNCETSEDFWLTLNQKSSSSLVDGNGFKLARIKPDGLFTMKKKIMFQMPASRIEAKWSPKLVAFKLKATSTIKGYEKIHWKWILNHNSFGLTLKDCSTGDIIANFSHIYRAYHEVGSLEILKENMPDDLKMFIASTTAYTFFNVFREVPHIIGWDMNN